MAAPLGNQFWKLRSKHGRDKLFESSELLWEAACEYFDWCIENPWYKSEAIKSGDLAGEIIKVPTQRPFTLIGLCLYLGCSESYFRKFQANNITNEDFITALTRIEETIKNNKYEGGMVGAYNANIVMRDLGMTDNTALKHSGDADNPIKTENKHEVVFVDMTTRQ